MACVNTKVAGLFCDSDGYFLRQTVSTVIFTVAKETGYFVMMSSMV